MKIISAILLFAVLVCAATTATPQRGQAWYTPFAYVPITGSAADVMTETVFLDRGYFANATASAATCLLKDRTTACNSAACQFWPTVSIAANSVYTVDFGGIIVTSGVNWSCSAANTVAAQLTGAYPR